MRKSIISYIIIIISIILCIKIVAYVVGVYPGTEGLVNEFDPSLSGQPTPPYGRSNDITKWEANGAPPPLVGGGTPITSDLNYPTSPLNGAYSGTNAGRVKWVNEGQYILLKSDYFENVGCNPTPMPDYSNYDPANAKDWSCYDYIVFYVYLNLAMNNCPETIYQPVSIFDGTVTFTASRALNCENDRVWDEYFAISINYLKNQTINGHRFDTTNIKSFTIHAPDVGSVDYSQWGLTGDMGRIIVYYDYLTLGADAMPNSPPASVNISIDNSLGYAKAKLEFNQAPQTGTYPISAYHIYKSINGGPYYGVDFRGNSPGVNVFIDIEGNQTGNTITACYKVISCDNGPGIFDGVPNHKVNVTYNEGLLEDATEVCIDLPPVPTLTPTHTLTVDPTLALTLTALATLTPLPTLTPTHTLTVDPTLALTLTALATLTPLETPTATSTPEEISVTTAHVYPNPFNPEKGSFNFYVDNVPDKTKVKIYAMDGSLVNEGEYTKEKGRFKWNGRNKNGTKVVTGLYYLVLQSPDGKTDVKRIIVCYSCDPVYQRNQ